MTIRTRRMDGNVEIRIAKNGVGISEDKRRASSSPFSRRSRRSGTGLGLSMTYDIVTGGHGGTIEVESVEGKGAAFVVRLPG